MNRICYGLECLRMQGARPWLEGLGIAGLFILAGNLAIMCGVV